MGADLDSPGPEALCGCGIRGAVMAASEKGKRPVVCTLQAQLNPYSPVRSDVGGKQVTNLVRYKIRTGGDNEGNEIVMQQGTVINGLQTFHWRIRIAPGLEIEHREPASVAAADIGQPPLDLPGDVALVCQENAIGLFQIPLFFSEMHCPGSGPVTEGAAPASCGITVGTGESCIDAHSVNPLSVTRDKIV